MTMTTTQAIVTIAAVVLGTMATRFIPSRNRTSVCGNRTSCHLLSERCPCKQYTWTS